MMLFAELEVRQMKENKTESKPSTELVHNEISHSRTPKFRLKFTDYATEKYQANLIIKDKNGNIKIKDRDYVPYDVSKQI